MQEESPVIVRIARWLLLTAALWALTIFSPEAAVILGVGMRFAGAVLAWAFCLRYGRIRWRATEEGRHIMSMTMAMALFLTWASLNTVTAYIDPLQPPTVVDGDYPGRPVIGLLLFAWTVWLLLKRNQLLTNAQRQVRSIK